MNILEVSEMADVVEQSIIEIRHLRLMSDSNSYREELKKLLDKLHDVLHTLDQC
jgi:hypothetical protein